LGNAEICDLPRHQTIRATHYEVHHALVLEQYGKTMAVERGISYILSPTEEGYQSFPLHDAKQPALVSIPHEIMRKLALIYITMRAYEHKEELQSYYKLIEEDLEDISKDWSVKLLILVDPTEMSKPEPIRSPKTTHEAKDLPGPSRTKKT
jgi:hypothetical protein